MSPTWSLDKGEDFSGLPCHCKLETLFPIAYSIDIEYYSRPMYGQQHCTEKKTWDSLSRQTNSWLQTMPTSKKEKEK